MLRISPKAQASIEYMTIVVLVVTGIVLMGPYVIRSINAHFQSIDDQVVDSFSEEIKQAPDSDYKLPTCTCSGFNDQGCGPLASEGLCGDYDRFSKKICTPLGCEDDPATNVGQTKKCTPDPTCCTSWINNGCGGPSNLPGINCAGNEMSQIQTCNNGLDTDYQCVGGLCFYACTPPLIPGAILCPGDDQSLSNNFPYVLAAGLNCTTITAPGVTEWSWGGVNNYNAFIRVWGAGGGGGGNRVASSSASGGGGGGGGYVEGLVQLKRSAGYRVTVGDGASALGDGDLSMFQSIISGTTTTLMTGGGGKNGATGNNGAGGAGGTATGGITRFVGQRGVAATAGNGGKGGDSGGVPGGVIGAGGAGTPICTGCLPNAGVPGVIPGGGGGGGGKGTGQSPARNTGGAGANGRVDVCYGNGGCTDARKCEVYCPAGSLPNPTGTACMVPIERIFKVAPPIECNDVSHPCNTTTNWSSFRNFGPDGPGGGTLCAPIGATITSVSILFGGAGCGNPGNPGPTRRPPIDVFDYNAAKECVAVLW